MEDLNTRLATCLERLRRAQGWTLNQLAAESGVSRAALSRLENAEISPTADVLCRLSAAYGLPLSRLMLMVENRFDPFVPLETQRDWTDASTGFTRRVVSPLAAPLLAEVQECHLPPDTTLSSPPPSTPGQEHHLVMLDGTLTLTLPESSYTLSAGDCLRYHLTGSSVLCTGVGRGARYMLVVL